MNFPVPKDHDWAKATPHYQFPGLDISWVGESPSGKGLWFGSDDGRLGFLEPGQPPINGLAFANGHVAASTRAEVVVFDLPKAGLPEGERAVFQGGALDVLVTPSNRFVAPLGPGGILSFHYELGARQTMKVLRAPEMDMVFYRVACPGQSRGVDVLAVAARRHGVLRMVLNDGVTETFCFSHPGMDIVDVCGLGEENWPHAGAALTLDGSILLFGDILKEAPPLIQRFPELKGRGYRILQVGGNLIVHTSDAVYVLENYLRVFIQDGFPPVAATMHSFPFEAIDIFAVYGRLIVLTTEGAFNFDMPSLLGETGFAAASVERPTTSQSDNAISAQWKTGFLPPLEVALP